MSTHLTKLVRNWKFGSSTDKLIARELAECCTNDLGKNIFPSQAHIENTTECHRNTIQKALKRLEEANIIKTTSKGTGRATTRLEFTEEWIKQAQAKFNNAKAEKATPHNPFNYTNEKTGEIITFPNSPKEAPTKPKEPMQPLNLALSQALKTMATAKNFRKDNIR